MKCMKPEPEESVRHPTLAETTFSGLGRGGAWSRQLDKAMALPLRPPITGLIFSSYVAQPVGQPWPFHSLNRPGVAVSGDCRHKIKAEK